MDYHKWQWPPITSWELHKSFGHHSRVYSSIHGAARLCTASLSAALACVPHFRPVAVTDKPAFAYRGLMIDTGTPRTPGPISHPNAASDWTGRLNAPMSGRSAYSNLRQGGWGG